MNDILATSKTSVADVLSATPGTARVFIDHQTACVSCYLARLCTLEEVASSYEFDLDPFLKAINLAMQSNQRSNSNESS
ncbi:MAG: hypothetical protein AB1649_12265 [Chloroflexota bacterium]